MYTHAGTHIHTEEKRILIQELNVIQIIVFKIQAYVFTHSRNRNVCRRNNQKTRKRSWKLKTCLPYTLNLSLPLSLSLFLSCTHKLTLTDINYSFQTSCMNMFYGRRVIPGGVHYQIWKGFLVALSDEALRKPFSVERLILAH